jgi:hypothetical protein
MLDAGYKLRLHPILVLFETSSRAVCLRITLTSSTAADVGRFFSRRHHGM